MIVVAGIVLLLLLANIIYVAAKVVRDIKANRAGWAAIGVAALLGILALFALGFLAMFGIGAL